MKGLFQMRAISNELFYNEKLSNALQQLQCQRSGNSSRRIYPPIDKTLFNTIAKGSDLKAEEHLFYIMKDNWETIIDFLIDDNCLMLFDIVEEDDIMIKANIQVFILENCEFINFCSQEDYDDLKLKNKFKVYYYRLDYHPDSVGQIFAEPLPHIHTNVKHGFRFNMSYEKDDFIFTFLESIFINHYYEKWKLWINRFVTSDYVVDDYNKISEMYKQSKCIDIVETYSMILNKIKEDIEHGREKFFIWKTDENFRKTLSYRSIMN